MRLGWGSKILFFNLQIDNAQTPLPSSFIAVDRAFYVLSALLMPLVKIFTKHQATVLRSGVYEKLLHLFKAEPAVLNVVVQNADILPSGGTVSESLFWPGTASLITPQ